MGADVRLIVPGDGCLRCCGDVADEIAALRGPTATPWETARAGSLASLNQLAVAVGVRMLEDLGAGRAQGSRWLRLHFDEAGELLVNHPSWNIAPACPLCARSGEGDGAFASIL